MKSSFLKLHLLPALYFIACTFACSPFVMAAEQEEEAVAEPVWVVSYASFLMFAAGTVFLSVFFSRRRPSALSAEEQKNCAQLRNERVKQRRKEEMYARIHSQKKH